MEARNRYNQGAGNNLCAQDRIFPHQAVDNVRQSNTFKSNINFKAPQEHPKALESYKKATRDRQFVGNPV